ncbi:MAG: DegT/DnrJ/EryC1/StrS family aminotransferase, partial [Pseudomonadota bacterium]|nr:DegT/DnrJ/EryC1/StrS family aminotransferase [Pseudomonadota bacterium]
MRVPFNDLSRGGEQSAALETAFGRVLARGRFVLGEEVASFEDEFARYCGVEHCIGVANGSDALEIALRAAQIGHGDQVITVANAAMYASLAILACGATPVYADVDPQTLTISPGSVEAALSPRTRALIVTHLYGRLADIGQVRRVVRERAIIIEDCAQAHGARTAEGRAGGLASAGCFSFYPTKNLGALGDGGAITTADPELARRARALRQYGWDGKYRVTLHGGRNSRLDEVQAAILRERLPNLDACNAQRRAIAAAYARRIRHPAITFVDPPGPAESSVAHL